MSLPLNTLLISFRAAAGFSDSIIRIYNLDQLGRARSRLGRQHRTGRPEPNKRHKGSSGDRGADMEPAIDVDTEAAELQVRLREGC